MRVQYIVYELYIQQMQSSVVQQIGKITQMISANCPTGISDTANLHDIYATQNFTEFNRYVAQYFSSS